MAYNQPPVANLGIGNQPVGQIEASTSQDDFNADLRTYIAAFDRGEMTVQQVRDAMLQKYGASGG